MLSLVKRLFKNTIFRLSMIAATLFVLSSLVVLGYIYFATVRAETVEVDKLLEEGTERSERFYFDRLFEGI